MNSDINPIACVDNSPSTPIASTPEDAKRANQFDRIIRLALIYARIRQSAN